MDKNITEFQNHIRLVVKKPVKKIWQKMFLNIVTKIGPAGIVRPVHIIDEFGATKQIHLRSYKMEDDFIYEVPLVRNLEEKEAEKIIKMWAKFYDVGDFIIETSTPYKDDETVADDSDDVMTCCEKAKLKHNKWMHNKVKEGYRYGLTYSEQNMTHPMLRPWEQLPAQYRQIDESTIFGGILNEVKHEMSAEEVMVGLKERDPTTIQFAQSVGMPPAVITQYGELAQQFDQQDVPRKVKIAFLNAEEEIVDFIENKLSQVAKGLSKKISRRDLFRGAGNLAQMLSTLTTASKLMQALPKIEPDENPVSRYLPTFIDWMSDDKVLEFLPYRLHEEFLNLFTSGPLPKEEYILQVNEWFNSYGLPWHATDMKEGDDNFVWKLTRTEAEEESTKSNLWHWVSHNEFFDMPGMFNENDWAVRFNDEMDDTMNLYDKEEVINDMEIELARLLKGKVHILNFKYDKRTETASYEIAITPDK